MSQFSSNLGAQKSAAKSVVATNVCNRSGPVEVKEERKDGSDLGFECVNPGPTVDLLQDLEYQMRAMGQRNTATFCDRTEQLAMIDLNVRALTELSLAFIDSLARHRGGILNVASLAAFLPGPGMAVYYASKAYVLSFSEALHHELAGLGVRVTALCPGPVATGFQARAGLQRHNPRMLALSASRVARIGYRGFMRGERVVVAGIPNRIVASLLRFMPHGLLLSFADQRGRSVPRRS